MSAFVLHSSYYQLFTSLEQSAIQLPTGRLSCCVLSPGINLPFHCILCATNADKPLIIFLQMQIYFLDHVVLHSDQAEFVQEKEP